MSPPRFICMDGNQAAADVAYRLSEVCAIYPITPSSAMGELADEWRQQQRPNLWGFTPEVIEMQSEAGAAGTLHGALQAGALATSFTSSQGLLLMLPNLYRIAGELTPCVLHIASRAIATHALSIFGDHADAMAARTTGCALLFAADPQEAHDLALVAHAATLLARIPFLHIFDGFRTSHELTPIQRLQDEDLAALIPEAALAAHRARGLNPNRPVLRGTAQNPDVFFQNREAANPWIDAVPGIVARVMQQVSNRTGRPLDLLQYTGAPDAERVILLMGSAAHTSEATALHLQARGEKVGVLRIRLFRPWPAEALRSALPPTVRRIAVLDRCKEPGAFAEPLCLDVLATLGASHPHLLIIGGRYGLGSKEFTPAMAAAVFDELNAPTPKPRFTVGIHDDVTHLSLPLHRTLHLEDPNTVRAVFYGLGSDGTVGATRNTLQILTEHTALHAQAYFVFDSNKSGSRTVSHLRFGPAPIRAPYLIEQATFIACHQFQFTKTIDLLERATHGATCLLNTPHGPDTLFRHLPAAFTRQLREKDIQLWGIDAARIAREAGLGGRINTVMQTCFFALHPVLSGETALNAIRDRIREAYRRKGSDTVAKNLAAVEATLAALHRIPLPGTLPEAAPLPPPVPEHAPDFVRNVTARLLADQGNLLPVSALPPDGTWPTDTARWNRRDLSETVPAWEADLCIQCGHCVLVCPHGVIRAKQAEAPQVPPAVKSTPLRGENPDLNLRYLLDLHLPDCTGCGLCVEICPAKDRSNPSRKSLNMQLKAETDCVSALFDAIPERQDLTNPATVRGVQYLPATFTAPGACAGCGETPYLKLISQLFGDRMLVANATGCSSIYGGNLPTTPWGVDNHGRGPAWANSLFEDNAEFGLGFRIAADVHYAQARERLRALKVPDKLHAAKTRLLGPPPEVPSEWRDHRHALQQLTEACPETAPWADALLPRSVWLVGGDGWAYDIGLGGLEHVLSTSANVNLLVLDTEVYSNTGGQASKSTPLGAAAKFATAGKATAKHDLAMSAILKGNVYVATLALGAKLPQALRALREAEAYPGPSLLLAYSPCIAHGYALTHALDQSARAVDSGYWPLFRFDPRLRAAGKPALQLDSPEPSLPLREFLSRELRFKLPEFRDPALAEQRLQAAQAALRQRYARLKSLAEEVVS